MTEMIFTQGNMEFKLNCIMCADMLKDSVHYSFKLLQREKGKRKWQQIKEECNGYYYKTVMENILKYLSKDQVMSLAKLEYQKYTPSKRLFDE